MAKEFYRILEINENATQEDIKKAYQKLAKKWHPDKNKSPEATEKMQEINKAFEVLGNEEKRKKYDLGATDFAFKASGFNYEEELKNLREEQKILACKDAINIIGFEMLIAEIYPPQLNSNL
jgi:DnaJ-class molecular chaperone